MSQTQTDETAPAILSEAEEAAARSSAETEVGYIALPGTRLRAERTLRLLATLDAERARADAAQRHANEMHSALLELGFGEESGDTELRAECEKLRSKVAEMEAAAVQVESVFAWMKTAFINSDDVQYLQGIGAAHHSCHGREEALFLMGKWGIEPESNEVSDD